MPNPGDRATPKNPAWAELVQLVPVVSLALPFVIEGKVDLERAGRGFLTGALLSIVTTMAVLHRRHLVNPILLGTNMWLWLGAVAFAGEFEPLKRWLSETQGCGLFVIVLVVGAATTLWFPHGFVGCRSSSLDWIRGASYGLMALTLAVVGFSWAFRQDIRIGGGLPFILLNVTRRVICVRAPR
ncbi:MAG: hypothetical protein JW751_31275 [Polyangiaceae bacterium]|nr:hypothetical protein [Polyangiaceae bacterium]